MSQRGESGLSQGESEAKIADASELGITRSATLGCNRSSFIKIGSVCFAAVGGRKSPFPTTLAIGL